MSVRGKRFNFHCKQLQRSLRLTGAVTLHLDALGDLTTGTSRHMYKGGIRLARVLSRGISRVWPVKLKDPISNFCFLATQLNSLPGTLCTNIVLNISMFYLAHRQRSAFQVASD